MLENKDTQCWKIRTHNVWEKGHDDLENQAKMIENEGATTLGYQDKTYSKTKTHNVEFDKTFRGDVNCAESAPGGCTHDKIICLIWIHLDVTPRKL